MRISHPVVLLAAVMTLGSTLVLLKPQPYVAMEGNEDAVTVASDVPAEEVLPAEAPAADTPSAAAAKARPARAQARLAPPDETSQAPAAAAPVTISQDVPTAAVPLAHSSARLQDDPGPPPEMDPGNGPPPGPPPDDDMGPPPGGGPPPGMPLPPN